MTCSLLLESSLYLDVTLFPLQYTFSNCCRWSLSWSLTHSQPCSFHLDCNLKMKTSSTGLCELLEGEREPYHYLQCAWAEFFNAQHITFLLAQTCMHLRSAWFTCYESKVGWLVERKWWWQERIGEALPVCMLLWKMGCMNNVCNSLGSAGS